MIPASDWQSLIGVKGQPSVENTRNDSDERIQESTDASQAPDIRDKVLAVSDSQHTEPSSLNGDLR